MKATIEQLTSLLKAAGVAHVEVVDSDADSEYNQKEALSLIDNSRLEILKPRIVEDSKDEWTKESDGRLYGIFNRKLAQVFGIPAAELTKLDTIDKRVDAAKSHYDKQFEGDKVDIEKRINDMLSSYNDKEAKINQEWQEKYDTLQRQHNEGMMLDFMEQQIKDVPTMWDKKVAARDILKHAQENYHTTWDAEKRQIKYFDKANTNMPAVSANNILLTEKEIAKSFLEPRGGWEKDTRNIKPTDAMQGKQSAAFKPSERPATPGQDFLNAAKAASA